VGRFVDGQAGRNRDAARAEGCSVKPTPEEIILKLEKGTAFLMTTLQDELMPCNPEC
jgi:hypothetical protein